MSTEVTQSVTSKKSDIPAGFIAISSFGCHKGNTDQKASAEYKALYQAWCDERISGIKLMKSVHDKRGQIFVDPVSAERVIAEYRQPKPTLKSLASAASTHGEFLRVVEQVYLPGVLECLQDFASSFERTEKLIERLTAAVECVAAQSKAETAGTWRDMNGESL